MQRFLITLGVIALVGVITIPALFIVIYIFIASPVQINGASMSPAMTHGQYYMVDKLAYRLNSPQRNDVVIYKRPEYQDIDFISRIIALPTDTLVLRDGRMYVNNQAVTPSGVQINPGKYMNENKEITLSADEYFVLGDNSERSSDSREWGLVHRSDIKGKTAWCYYKCN